MFINNIYKLTHWICGPKSTISNTTEKRVVTSIECCECTTWVQSIFAMKKCPAKFNFKFITYGSFIEREQCNTLRSGTQLLGIVNDTIPGEGISTFANGKNSESVGEQVTKDKSYQKNTETDATCIAKGVHGSGWDQLKL
ncbi:hypothetical protein EPI10_006258 [Gossypium australe]|uniref:Uncharacterized protein n=1 Tax=Gossypium australe TaxID=47621 RepID=A0A5B6WTG3_9ROSI|nr:hypothetical protein EPI10_006258 [Gossypium australe]